MAEESESANVEVYLLQSDGEVTMTKLQSNETVAARSPFDDQIGGTHYKNMVIQPVDYIVDNDLDWFQGNIVKYVSRHKAKGGETDLKKVVHYALMALERYYGIEGTVSYVSKQRIQL